jgi:hypothetical protein
MFTADVSDVIPIMVGHTKTFDIRYARAGGVHTLFLFLEVDHEITRANETGSPRGQGAWM